MGEVAIWDLRRPESGPTFTCAVGPACAITGLEYAQHQLIASTAAGTIVAISNRRVNPLYSEGSGAALSGLTLSTSGAATQLFAALGEEVMLFMANYSYE